MVPQPGGMDSSKPCGLFGRDQCSFGIRARFIADRAGASVAAAVLFRTCPHSTAGIHRSKATSPPAGSAGCPCQSTAGFPSQEFGIRLQSASPPELDREGTQIDHSNQRRTRGNIIGPQGNRHCHSILRRTHVHSKEVRRSLPGQQFSGVSHAPQQQISPSEQGMSGTGPRCTSHIRCRSSSTGHFGNAGMRHNLRRRNNAGTYRPPRSTSYSLDSHRKKMAPRNDLRQKPCPEHSSADRMQHSAQLKSAQQ